MRNTQTSARATDGPAHIASQDTVLTGAPLGRRERTHGSLRTIADLSIDAVAEAVVDLAVADRVAWILARRTGRTHVVVAAATHYLVATTNQELTAADAERIAVNPDLPVASIATPDGIIPVLIPRAFMHE